MRGSNAWERKRLACSGPCAEVIRRFACRRDACAPQALFSLSFGAHRVAMRFNANIPRVRTGLPSCLVMLDADRENRYALTH